MSLAEKIQQASFKGVKFLFRGVKTQGGQKTVTHEFPNSNRRAVEDLGALPEIFTIIGVVHGDNYTQDLETLRRVLSEGGEGDFVHPTQGSFSVKAITYTINEEEVSLGSAIIEMIFERQSAEIQPQSAGVNVSSIAKQSIVVQDAISANIEDNYNVTPQAAGNFADALSQVREIGTSFENNSRKVTQIATEISSYQREILTFVSQANTLIQSPKKLANAIQLLWGGLDALPINSISLSGSENSTVIIPTTPGTGLSGEGRGSLPALEAFYDFGDVSNPLNTSLNQPNDAALRFPSDTAIRAERNKNRDILQSSIKAGALTESYREASLVNYQNVNEIDRASQRLEDQFEVINDSAGLSDDVLVQMEKQRDLVRKLFDDKRLRADSVISLQLPILPSAVQSYSLYGTVDNAESLIDLNDTTDTAFIGGQDTQVLTS